MTFTEDMEKLIFEIKQDIKAVESYVKQLENDNIYWDIWTIENIITDLSNKVNELYVLAEPEE